MLHLTLAIPLLLIRHLSTGTFRHKLSWQTKKNTCEAANPLARGNNLKKKNNKGNKINK